MSLKRWNILLLVSSLSVCATCLSISSNQSPLFQGHSNATGLENDGIQVGKVISDELSTFVKRMTEMWEVKGTTIAVVRPGGEIEFGSWGIKSEDGEKMTPETLLNIASCSKAFLASTMGILMHDFQRGRNQTSLPTVNSFSWSTKVKDVLPDEWELQDCWANEKVDILDILSHRSGMPRHDGSNGPKDTARDVVKRLKYLRPAYEPRQKFAYNNQMFVTGAHIISKYSPMHNYPDFVKERIFTPLGMKSTTFSPKAASDGGNLTQSWTAHSRRIPFAYSDSSVDMIAGAGGIITNVVDLSRWIQVLLNKGVDPISNETIIPRPVFNIVTTAHTLMNGNPRLQESSIVAYGMGWWRRSFKGHEMIQHTGGIPGFSSSVCFFPNDGFGIAILMNSGDKEAVNEAIQLRIAEDVLGLERTRRAENPKTAQPKQPTYNASSPVPFIAYAGTYRNPGYGSVTFCAPSSTSEYCSDVLDAFKVVDNAQSAPLPPDSTVPQLYAKWERFWSTHVRLVHVEETTFKVALTTLFLKGYGTNKKPFETFEMDEYKGEVKFVLDGKGENVEGFGFFGIGDDRRALGDAQGIKESSIAWFEKV
ncbi:beta-lactamase/transpeptidase-like protein [Schizopora paradoxa]|uniref:Beta-lactamase/transpeptidase-like protein n=1 Tax=Schizopora paradoxa TaxID=27342 RepID=A0A0H2RPL1_9AGAM|nr:beta-lactamase/transpeptidase-like protein [Schizopora paradoxa]